ncbi:MAG TPA: methyltransferase, partial [Acidobacteriota bacterium]|nr:methyltransferase [Acidobacteriota bacterium]
ASQTQAGQGGLTGLRGQYVSDCRTLYDGIYELEQEYSTRDPGINFRVWTDGFNQPYQEEEILEYVDDTAGRILQLRPQRVLEVGAGTGLLLFRLAPHCQSYHATDVSPSAAEYLRRRLKAQRPPLSGVSVEQRAAHDFKGLEKQSFDAMVLNLVAMHFPDAEYLIGFLEKAVELLAPGGFLFAGGLRSLPLFETFLTRIQLESAPASLSRRRLRDRVRERAVQEKDLLIDPALFSAFGQSSPYVGHVEIRPLGGRSHNDLNRYLYDAVLHLCEPPRLDAPSWRDWKQEGLDLAALRRLLIEKGPRRLAFFNVPNARLAKDVRLQELMALADGPRTAGELRKALRRETFEEAVDPAQLWDLGKDEDVPYDVQLSWASNPSDGSLDLVLSRGRKSSPQSLWFPPRGVFSPKPWNDYVNKPLQGMRSKRLDRELRRFLETALPDSHVPSFFVFLDSLPRNPNGKVAREALARPQGTVLDESFESDPPQGETEIRIAGIWRELLPVEKVGRHTDFFQLGGHSLLATQVVNRLRYKMTVEVALLDFLKNPTIAALAEKVEEARKSSSLEQAKVAQVLKEVRGLSEGEVEAMLSEGRTN